jgi:hypothetical protein
VDEEHGEPLAGVTVTLYRNYLAPIPLPGAAITGTVTGPDAAPLGLIHVLAYRVVDGEPEPSNWPAAGDDYTNLHGGYRIPGLPAGIYRVEFRTDYPAPPYATEYYDNAASLNAATDIVVAENAIVAGINAQLAPRASLSGLVTNPEGQPPANPGDVFVLLYHDPANTGVWTHLQGVHIDASGAYTFTSLDPGVYRVGFFDAGFPELYSAEYYDDATDLSVATNIVVTAGEHVTGINAQLGPIGRIDGVLLLFRGESE